MGQLNILVFLMKYYEFCAKKRVNWPSSKQWGRDHIWLFFFHGLLFLALHNYTMLEFIIWFWLGFWIFHIRPWECPFWFDVFCYNFIHGWQTSHGYKGRIFVDTFGEFSWTRLSTGTEKFSFWVNFRGHFWVNSCGHFWWIFMDTFFNSNEKS